MMPRDSNIGPPPLAHQMCFRAWATPTTGIGRSHEGDPCWPNIPGNKMARQLTLENEANGGFPFRHSLGEPRLGSDTSLGGGGGGRLGGGGGADSRARPGKVSVRPVGALGEDRSR